MTDIVLVNLVTFFAGVLPPALAAPFCYQNWTRGAWRKSREGKHLMAYMTVLAVALGLTAVAAFVNAMWLYYVAPVVHVALSVVLWQRIVVMWANQHPKDKTVRGHTPL